MPLSHSKAPRETAPSHVNPLQAHRVLRGLYLVTPDEPDTAFLIERVRPVLGQAALLQYRNKRASASLRREQAAELLAACRDAGVPLIINDDWRLALHLGAQGVHLGAGDGNVEQARAALGPDALIGASCYDNIGAAQRAAAASATYVAFGAFFASPTKPDAPRASADLFQQARALCVPRVAIGGITADNARQAVDAGADLLAVISGVFDAADPISAAKRIAALFE